MKDILEVKDLTKNYRDFCLDHVSFSVPSGSIMGLIGENGAGKTTTIKAILQLIAADEGSITLFGTDYAADEKLIKSRLGVVFDECNFHQYMNAERVCKIMASLHPAWDEALFRQYLQKFNVPENKIVHEMSRGMRVKFSIAAALAHRPQLLILDESTSGLDPVSRDEILEVFLEFIQDEDHAVLVSSHITSDLEKVADYITFIHQGKVALSRSKDELVYNYGVMKCKSSQFAQVAREDMVAYLKKEYGYEILVKNKEKMITKYKDFTVDSVNLEDIMLFYIRGEVVCGD